MTSLRLHHESIHSKKRNYQCTLCKLQFSIRQQLIWHENCHKPDYRFVCAVCDQHFKYKGGLNRHMKTKHVNVGERPFVCSKCHKSFTTNTDRKRHERSHGGYKLYKCTFPGCAKSYSRKEELDFHLNSHYGLKPYSCSSCDATYASPNALYSHERLKHGSTK